MCKHKILLRFQKCIFALLLITGVIKMSQANEPKTPHDDDNVTDAEIFALIDFETGQIYYKDEQLAACFVENFHPLDQNADVLIMQHLLTIPPEDIINIPTFANQFCGDFPVYALAKLGNTNYLDYENRVDTVRRNKRSAGQWYPGGAGNLGGASQSQVQGQVSGQGFFSGQAQSQLSGSSQTQVQLSGNGILGSVSSSAGNAQAQINLGEFTGSGQAGSLGIGPSKSQVQVNLGQNGRGSMASAGVLADEAYSHSSDGRQYGHAGLGIGGGGFDHGMQRSGGGPLSYSNYGYQAPRHDSTSATRKLSGDPSHYQPNSNLYGAADYNGAQPSRFDSYPAGYQAPLTSNGEIIKTQGINVHPTSQYVPHLPANLPQLPDIGSRGYPSPLTPVSFEDLRTQGRFPTAQGGVGSTGSGTSYPTQAVGGGGLHTNGIGRDSNKAYRQPTVTTGQYPTSIATNHHGRNGGGGYHSTSSRNGYDGGRGLGGSNTAYAGGSGLPHAIASSYGAGQAQAQSQMVHLGRGTTEFYRPQQHSNGGSLSSSYPQTNARRGNGPRNGVTSFTTGAQYPGPRTNGNGKFTESQSRSSNGQAGGHQHSTPTGQHVETYPQRGTVYSPTLSRNTTRETIRDGYIPTDDGYVRPYLNGVPRQEAGNNINGQYSATFTTHSPITPSPRIPLTPEPISPFDGQSVDQQTHKSPGFTHTLQHPAQGQPAFGTNGGYQRYYPGNNGHQTYPPSGQHPIPTSYGRPQTYQNGVNYNGGSNGKKCSIVTFTCTILIESNGRAKICRPNGSQAQSRSSSAGTMGEDSSGSGQVNHGRSMQICCC